MESTKGRHVKTSLKCAAISLLVFAVIGGAASSASAAGRIWAGTGFNDLGPSTVTFKVVNGRAKITSLQVLMACTDTSDGSESTRAFSMGRGPTDTLNQNRFHFRFDKRSGGRLAEVKLNGRLNSNGRGHARIDLTAVGRTSGGGAIVERCSATSRIPLRRGPAG